MNKRTLEQNTILAGKYIVDSVIGEGGFGVTYKCKDLNIDTYVAIKEYFPSEYSTRQGDTVSALSGELSELYQRGLEKFVKEAEILAKFNTLPGIVSVKEFFYENETAYMVMEFIDGITLSKYLKAKGGKISYKEALMLMKPIMESLHIVHKVDIVHRDISPDNIMITTEGRMKLIDFGAARMIDTNNEKSLTVILKHGYAPVEQYQRDGKQGSWTDVYAICATLYKMITGTVPQESTDRMMNGDHLVSIHKLDTTVPNGISNAIERGLVVNHEKRTQSMEKLLQDLYVQKTNKRIAYAGAVMLAAIVLFCMTAISGKHKLFVEDDQVTTKDEPIFSETSEKVIEVSSYETVEPESIEESVEIELTREEKDRLLFDEFLRTYSDTAAISTYYQDFTNDGRDELIILNTYVQSGYEGDCYLETKVEMYSVSTDEEVIQIHDQIGYYQYKWDEAELDCIASSAYEGNRGPYDYREGLQRLANSFIDENHTCILVDHVDQMYDSYEYQFDIKTDQLGLSEDEINSSYLKMNVGDTKDRAMYQHLADYLNSNGTYPNEKVYAYFMVNYDETDTNEMILVVGDSQNYDDNLLSNITIYIFSDTGIKKLLECKGYWYNYSIYHLRYGNQIYLSIDCFDFMKYYDYNNGDSGNTLCLISYHDSEYKAFPLADYNLTMGSSTFSVLSEYDTFQSYFYYFLDNKITEYGGQEISYEELEKYENYQEIVDSVFSALGHEYIYLCYDGVQYHYRVDDFHINHVWYYSSDKIVIEYLSSGGIKEYHDYSDADFVDVEDIPFSIVCDIDGTKLTAWENNFYNEGEIEIEWGERKASSGLGFDVYYRDYEPPISN